MKRLIGSQLRVLTGPTAILALAGGVSSGATVPFADHFVAARECPRHLAIGDLDGDGDRDVVIFCWEGGVVWYQSDGGSPPTFAERTLDPGPYGFWWHGVLVDLDDDDDLDIIASAYDGNAIVWYRNDGSATPSFELRTLATSLNRPQCVGVGDIDLDGDIDVACASINDNTIAWFESDGGATPAFTAHAVGHTMERVCSIAIADFDADGDLDLLAGSMGSIVGWGGTGEFIRWFENDDSALGTFGERIVSGCDGDRRAIGWGDFDADGLPDVLDTCSVSEGQGEFGRVMIHRNRGDGTFERNWRWADFWEWSFQSCASGDMDADGDLDIVITSTEGGSDVCWLESPNDGSVGGVLVPRTIAHDPSTAFFGLGVADIDDDGDPDVVATGMGANVRWFENTLQVVNATRSIHYGTIEAAVEGALGGEVLRATPARFGLEPTIDFAGKAISLESLAGLVQPNGGAIIPADAARLAAARAMTLGGSLTLSSAQRVWVEAAALGVGSMGRIEAGVNAQLMVSAPGGARLEGTMLLMEGSSAVFDAGVVLGVLRPDGEQTEEPISEPILRTVLLPGSLLLAGGELVNEQFGAVESATIAGASFRNEGTLRITGTISSDADNTGETLVVADTLVDGDWANSGLTRIAGGTLSVLGSLSSTGDIVRDSVARSGVGVAAGGGMMVEGDVVLSRESCLSMPWIGSTVEVGGGWDVAIDSNARFDMSRAGLLMIGGGVRTLELMGEDVGAERSGLDRTLPGRFPVGTLQIGATGIVSLVDAHDNDGLGQDACEALYVGELVVDPGATLRTNGCRVYAERLSVGGVVDEPGNVQLVPPACVGDLDADNDTDVLDFGVYIAHFGSSVMPGTLGDYDGDGVVTVHDFAVLLGDFGCGG